MRFRESHDQSEANSSGKQVLKKPGGYPDDRSTQKV